MITEHRSLFSAREHHRTHSQHSMSARTFLHECAAAYARCLHRTPRNTPSNKQVFAFAGCADVTRKHDSEVLGVARVSLGVIN